MQKNLQILEQMFMQNYDKFIPESNVPQFLLDVSSRMSLGNYM